MTMVQQSDEPTEYVPRIFFNHCGSMGWSGRHVSELTGMEVVAILEFCQSEGSRSGWNDSLNDRIGEREAGPFHQDLLGGFPAQEWARSYRAGVEQQQQDQAQALPEPRNKRPRSGYLKAEVLSHAVENGEARLLARVIRERLSDLGIEEGHQHGK